MDHCTEQNLPVPSVPLVFSKFGSCIIGPDDGIPIYGASPTSEVSHGGIQVQSVVIVCVRGVYGHTATWNILHQCIL